MAEVRTGYSDYQAYVLKSPFEPSIQIEEPIGWEEDDFQLDRHKQYHGIFFTMSNNLVFYKDAMEYIILAYEIGGINTDLRLTKYEKHVVDGEVKWKVRYSAIADYSTMEIYDDKVKLNFNSFQLAELIRSHETDEFEIERETDINTDPIDPLETNKVLIEGRDITENGEATWIPASYSSKFTGSEYITPPTNVIAEGPPRHNTALIEQGYDESPDDITNEHMIYVSKLDPNETDTDVTINYDFTFVLSQVRNYWRLLFAKYSYDDQAAEWTQEETWILDTKTHEADGYEGMNGTFSYSGSFSTTCAWNEAIVFNWIQEPGPYPETWTFTIPEEPRSWYTISETSYYEATPDLNFIFTHDLIERLLYIITGDKNKLYSKYFGRTELDYAEDGECGLIGNISGLWLRKFEKDSTRYKSLTIALKDVISSVMAVFNVGLGIESTSAGERLRIETLKHFYRPEVVVRLPNVVSEVRRKVDKDLFFSGLHLGYEHGGDYEDSNGLDEPNTDVKWVTPIRKSNLKYERVSKIRADDYGKELTRRKPQLLYPDEDTKRDGNVWYLDLHRTDGLSFRERNWDEDRLQSEPTGIYSPNTWKSFFFTPQQMLFRHAWIFKAGMEPYRSRNITFASGNGNNKVVIHPDGRTTALSQDADIPLADLERPRFLPEEITFTHSVNNELMDWVLGTTQVEVNGEIEEIPNYYFKMEWELENGKFERGYLLNLKPKGKGTWTFQKANENLII